MASAGRREASRRLVLATVLSYERHRRLPPLNGTADEVVAARACRYWFLRQWKDADAILTRKDRSLFDPWLHELSSQRDAASWLKLKNASMVEEWRKYRAQLGRMPKPTKASPAAPTSVPHRLPHPAAPAEPDRWRVSISRAYLPPTWT